MPLVEMWLRSLGQCVWLGQCCNSLPPTAQLSQVSTVETAVIFTVAMLRDLHVAGQYWETGLRGQIVAVSTSAGAVLHGITRHLTRSIGS